MEKLRSIAFRYRQQCVCLIMLMLTLLACQIPARQPIRIDPETLQNVEKRYGKEAVDRIEEWQNLIETDNSATDLEKLEKVNDFFNARIAFVDDIIHWNKEDYWATPIETLASQAGDCEDFSIAKYFTLKALGIPESRMMLTYVKALELNQAHMVVSYYERPGAVPLVLDNLKTEILPATRRNDLLPVYSFNGEGLWTARQRGKGKFIGGSEKVKLWTDLLSRMGPST